MLQSCDSHRKLQLSSQKWTLSGRFLEDGEICTFPLDAFPFSVGRKPGLSLTLPRNTVSGTHAEFFEHDDQLFVKDLGSTNGTFVNGQRLTIPCALHDNDFIQFADLPFRLNLRVAQDETNTRCHDAYDQALAVMQLDRIIFGAEALPYYQPIIDTATRRIVAYEVLSRSRLVGLENPKAMFMAASQLGLTTPLSEKLRYVGVDGSSAFNELPHLYLNTHPYELETETLLQSCVDLRRLAPQQRITIEIHESAVTRVEEMVALRAGLEELEMSLAFDDFGAGQARIAELVQVRPKVIKFDRVMIQNLHIADSDRRRFVNGLVSIVSDLGIIPLAEGVETPEEFDACIKAGFQLSQGYLHGKPMPASYYLQSHNASDFSA